MKVIETQVEGVKLIEPKVFGDQRGFSWKRSKKADTRSCSALMRSSYKITTPVLRVASCGDCIFKRQNRKVSW